MPSPTINEKLMAVRQLVDMFKMERLVHLATTAISLVLLLASAVILIYREQGDPATLTLLFGSSGLISYSANRLLRMWDQAMKLVSSSEK